jgi:hypothetical protein
MDKEESYIDSNGDEIKVVEDIWRCKRFYKNGSLFKTENINGIFYLKGENYFHREDGPAIERANGDLYWYYENKNIDCSSQEEFERILKLKLFW